MHKIGPSLADIIGRRAAHDPDFAYSPALKAAGEKGLLWSEDNLRAFLTDPRKFLPGNRMIFIGWKRVQQHEDFLAYLRAHSQIPAE